MIQEEFISKSKTNMAEDHEDIPVEVVSMPADAGDDHSLMADNVPSVLKNASLIVPLKNSVDPSDGKMDFSRGDDLFD